MNEWGLRRGHRPTNFSSIGTYGDVIYLSNDTRNPIYVGGAGMQKSDEQEAKQ